MSLEGRRKARVRREADRGGAGGGCGGFEMEGGAGRFLSKRAVGCSRQSGVCVCWRFASSPQPALVRVAARGQPSGHLASGGGAEGGEKVAVLAVEAGRKRRGEGWGEAEEAERQLGARLWMMGVKLAWCFGGFSACAPAAALKLKVAQAAFSERAPWVVGAKVECA